MTVILVALLVNVLIGTFQEERASQAFERLNASQVRRVRVLRDGNLKEISSEELVRGDIIELTAGAYVPADARILSARELEVNESILTGEWLPTLKSVSAVPEGKPLAEFSSMVWMGTVVVSGFGRGMVTATGNSTQMGAIAQELNRAKRQPTPLEESISELARFLMYLILGAIVVIFCLGLLRGETWNDLLLLSIAVAVATMPEGLPAVVTVVLALGMEAILKRGGLVRNLLAAETLGATTIILTDKTGTLTQAQLKLTGLVTLAEHAGLSGHEEDERALLEGAMLVSDAFVEIGESAKALVRGRPVEQAIIRAGMERGLSHTELLKNHPRLDYLAFSSKQRFGASLHSYGPERRLFVSGAPELLLENAHYFWGGGKRHRFDEKLKERVRTLFLKDAAEGKRIIAASYVDTQVKHIEMDKNGGVRLAGLTLFGFFVFSDPLRDDVPEAVSEVRQAGARVLMVTGDNPGTAHAVAKAAGIADGETPVCLGSDLEQFSDTELYAMSKEGAVFARMLPDDKFRLVRVLRDRGEVVAMTGDGVNDAPALERATIGIAVGSGTEVAKESSDMILVGNSFSIIVSAIREGRRILDNLKKVIAYLLATSSSEIVLIGASLMAGWPLPILPTQILWANMVEEGLMSFAFAFEPAEPDVMRRDPRSHATRSIVSSAVKRLIVVVSSVTGFTLVTLYATLQVLEVPLDEARTMMFVALSLGAIFFAFSLKNLGKPIWKIPLLSNRFLLVSLCVSLTTLLAALLIPSLRDLLSLTVLSSTQILVLVALGLGNLVFIEIVKYFAVYRRR
jgi:Ca2+-transporting ATPase